MLQSRNRNSLSPHAPYLPVPPPLRAALALALLFLLAPACGDKGFGGPCSLAGAGDGGAGTSTITSPVAECGSRICVQPGVTPPAGTGPLCTADCGSDADCADGMKADGAGDPRCRTGFTCRVAQTVGPHACRRLCLCRDFPEVASARSACP